MISKYHVAAGDNLDVGKPFFDIDEEGKKPEGSAPKKEESAPKSEPQKQEAKK